MPVNCLRREFLTGPAFSPEQDSNIRLSHTPYDVLYISYPPAVPKKKFSNAINGRVFFHDLLRVHYKHINVVAILHISCYLTIQSMKTSGCYQSDVCKKMEVGSRLPILSNLFPIHRLF